MARGAAAAAEPESRTPPPRANPELIGHEATEEALRALFDGGRLPHAIILSGPRGIGKATLAFRLARYVLAQSGTAAGGLFGDGGAPPETGGTGLAIAPDSGVFRRVAAGGHADLLTVERAFDPKRRRLRSEIVVDDARTVAGFLRLTAAEDGWRVVVVDGADEMNRNAANALLKILEEPPRQALLLLVAHSRGRLLPTIRSRCRHVALAPLRAALVRDLVARYRPDLAAPDVAALTALADGSVGRALELAEIGGVALQRGLIELLATAPRLDTVRLHAFADRLARADADESFRLVGELIARLLADLALAGLRPGAPETAAEEAALLHRLGAGRAPARWAELRQQIAQSFARTEQLNLDRKQALLGAFFAIAEAAG